MSKSLAKAAVMLGSTLVLLSACGLATGPPQSPEPEGKGIPEGPGLFSGEDGNLLSYSDEEGLRALGSGGRAAPTRDLSSEERARLYREFRDYQQFLEWREQAQGTDAYREFQDWREWRAYREWENQEN